MFADIEELKKVIGERLTEVGRSRGLDTRNKRAEFLGVSRRCLTNWELGDRMIAIYDLWEVAEKYGVPFPYLVGYTNEIEGPIQRELVVRYIQSPEQYEAAKARL